MSSEPHIYVNPNYDMIAPMPLGAPLGFINGRNEFGGYESGLPKIMLDDFGGRRREQDLSCCV